MGIRVGGMVTPLRYHCVNVTLLYGLRRHCREGAVKAHDTVLVS